MKRKTVILTVLIVFLIFGASYFFIKNLNLSNNFSSTTGNSPAVQIIFPHGNEILAKGQKYTLKWKPGQGNTQIFLINQALESHGTSVAISDRIYNVPNTGSYIYTVPQNIEDGSFKFEIGKLTSHYFQIASNEYAFSYCSSQNLISKLNLSPGAGNTYVTFTLKNASSVTCQIDGNNFISANYSASVRNITVTHIGTLQWTPLRLSPGQTIYAQAHYPNGPQCNGPTHITPVTFTYAISPGTSIAFVDNNGIAEQRVTTCSDDSKNTIIRIWSISKAPITP